MTTTSRRNLFSYAVWYRDPKDPANDKLIASANDVQAVDASHAERIAIRAIPESFADKLDNIKVDVRPF